MISIQLRLWIMLFLVFTEVVNARPVSQQIINPSLYQDQKNIYDAKNKKQEIASPIYAELSPIPLHKEGSRS